MLLLTTPAPAHGAGLSTEAVLSIVISISAGLMLLVGWFLVRTLNQVEAAIQANKAETAAARAELATVKSDLKGYAEQVQHQGEELTGLKKAYASLLRSFNAMDKWLYGQAMQGKLPHPPDFQAAAVAVEAQ